jgi:hypothetical protein
LIVFNFFIDMRKCFPSRQFEHVQIYSLNHDPRCEIFLTHQRCLSKRGVPDRQLILGQFARTGNPNVPGQPFWSEYTGKSRRYIRLNAHPSVDSGSLIYHEENCLLSAELNALILGEQIVFW